MNAMVVSITDAVKGVIHRSTNHPGSLRRFLLQGVVRRVLRDIHGHCTPLRRSNGSRPSSPRLEARHDARYSPRPVPRLVPRLDTRSSLLEYALGIYPEHGSAMFVRCAGASLMPTPSMPIPSSLPRPSSTLLPHPHPVPSTTPVAPWNGGGGSMASRRGVFSLHNGGSVERRPPGFAYDVDIVRPSTLPPPPIAPPGGRSYAVVTANRHLDARRTALPPSRALGARFASSLNEGEAAPRL
uniref:Uncharacterized protein n=1 Tax=Saccharum hybrid cultivar R570 TaxID=131158 RepID=A0A059Q2M1_9POAL|nr:hypothetical protein SHCRBa_014_L10_F_30 [Saccharum hybrid cultivar R570]